MCTHIYIYIYIKIIRNTEKPKAKKRKIRKIYEKK